mmetsp:Transcript_1193/g.1705  ORF Transcript_1193/g.1705 Transcript_1193/m.1705 type:complete len:837 (+) Transcript_1193:125-2635(+)
MEEGSPEVKKKKYTRSKSQKRLDKAFQFDAKMDVTDVRTQAKWANMIFGFFSGVKKLKQKKFMKMFNRMMLPEIEQFPDNPFFRKAYCILVLGSSHNKPKRDKLETNITSILKWVKDPKIPVLEYTEYEELIEVLTQRAYERLKSKHGKVTATDLAYLVMLLECGQYHGGNYTYHKSKMDFAQYITEQQFFDYLYYTLYIRISLPGANGRYEILKFMRFLADVSVSVDIFEKYGIHEARESELVKIKTKMQGDPKYAVLKAQSLWRKSIVRLKRRRTNAATKIQAMFRGFRQRRQFATNFAELQSKILKRKKSEYKRWTGFALAKLANISLEARLKRIREDIKMWHETRSKRTRKTQKGRWNPFPHWHLKQTFRVFSNRDDTSYQNFKKYLLTSPISHKIRPFISELWRGVSRKSSFQMKALQSFKLDDDGVVSSSPSSFLKKSISDIGPSNGFDGNAEMDAITFRKVIYHLIRMAFKKLDVDGGGLCMDEVQLFITLLKGATKHESETSMDLKSMAKAVHKMLDQDGNGDIDEEEFRGFLLWTWSNEMKTGSIHMIKYFMSLMACVVCEKAIVDSMQRKYCSGKKLRLDDAMAISAEESLFGIKAKTNLKLNSIKHETTSMKRNKKGRKKKKFPYLRPKQLKKKTIDEDPNGVHFPSVDGKDKDVSPVLKRKESHWNASFHIMKSRRNKAMPKSKKMYFEDIQSAPSALAKCLSSPSLRTVRDVVSEKATLPRLISVHHLNRNKKKLKANILAVSDPSSLRLVKNSLMMDKHIVGVYTKLLNGGRDRRKYKQKKQYNLQPLHNTRGSISANSGGNGKSRAHRNHKSSHRRASSVS